MLATPCQIPPTRDRDEAYEDNRSVVHQRGIGDRNSSGHAKKRNGQQRPAYIIVSLGDIGWVENSALLDRVNLQVDTMLQNQPMEPR